MSEDTWTTISGRKIKVCNMEDRHIINTIKLLLRTAEIKRNKIEKYYLNCPYPQGDIATYCFEQELDRVIQSTYEDYLPPIYCTLVEEAKKREIEIKEIKYESSILC